MTIFGDRILVDVETSVSSESSSSLSSSSSSSSLSSSSESSESSSSSFSSESSESSSSSESSYEKGCVTWGHDTGVVEPFARDFQGNWTGTAEIVGSGDAEKLEFEVGEAKESESRFLGSGTMTIDLDAYSTGKGSPTVKYRTAATEAACDAAGWTAYSGPFTSLGWVGVRLET